MNSEQKIKSIIQSLLQVDQDEITNDALLQQDLGADELDVVSILSELESAFSISFNSFDLKIRDYSVDELIDLVNSAPQVEEKLRTLHYLFEHKFIPELSFKDGINMFANFQFRNEHDFIPNSGFVSGLDPYGQPIKNGLKYLYDLWDVASQSYNCIQTTNKGLDFEVFQDKGILFILFYFPEPQIPGDAFFGLMGYNHSAVGRNSQEKSENAVSYLTFELGFDNERVIGEWFFNGTYAKHGNYPSDTTINQFIAESVDIIEHKDKSDLSNEYETTAMKISENIFNLSDNTLPIFKDHIFYKILLAFANKLNISFSQIAQNTDIKKLTKNDYIDIICKVYQMYSIDFDKTISLIESDVEDFLQNKNEEWFDCGLVVIKICQHFEGVLTGGMSKINNIYDKFLEKMVLIDKSPYFKALHPISKKTFVILPWGDVNMELLESKDLLFEEVLSISEEQLKHNFPIDPRHLFICFVSIGIAHKKFTKLNEKAEKYIEAAKDLNNKWGPFIASDFFSEVSKKSIFQKIFGKS